MCWELLVWPWARSPSLVHTSGRSRTNCDSAFSDAAGNRGPQGWNAPQGQGQHIITEFPRLALPHFCPQFSMLDSPCSKYLEWQQLSCLDPEWHPFMQFNIKRTPNLKKSSVCILPDFSLGFYHTNYLILCAFMEVLSCAFFLNLILKKYDNQSWSSFCGVNMNLLH